MINLGTLTKALPQLLQVMGSMQGGSLEQYAANVCKSQNIPIDAIVQQAKGIINMVGEQNLKNTLSQFGLKL
jgi:hypothetical protein